jgi:proteasome lid subunit RPN8/RPN11
MPEPVTQRRSTPYPGCRATICVPQEIWERTLQILRRFGEQASEGLVYWGGVVSAGDLQVTGLYAPGHTAQGAAVRLTPDESRWLLRRLRERDEKLIAQVHSHPGTAYHSPGDDEHATSFHTGFYSIVVPHYARHAQDIADCATFEFDGSSFGALGAGETGRRIRVLPLIEERCPDRVERPKPTWTRRISTFVSNLKRKLIGPRKP